MARKYTMILNNIKRMVKRCEEMIGEVDWKFLEALIENPELAECHSTPLEKETANLFLHFYNSYKIVGYCGKFRPGVYRGRKVKIPEGTVYHSTRDGLNHAASKNYTVAIFDIECGSQDDHCYYENPMVVWVGSGGYWCRADINQFPDLVTEFAAP